MDQKTLSEVKKIELEVMDYFVSICKKHHLTYYLFWGTLLGAVRHSGFIPWDDDIDVVMPPKDYIKFLNIMKKEKSDKYYLQNIYNEKHCTFFFSKIRKNRTTMVESNLNYLSFKKGINIDIFPLIPYPKNKINQFVFMYRFRLVSLLLNRDVKLSGAIGKIINFFLHLIPLNLCNKIEISKMEKLINYKKDFDEYRVYYYKGFDKNYFEKIELPFEDRKYSAPSSFHEILTKLYGDYMTPPPKEKRYGHGEGNVIVSFDKEYDEL